MADPNLMAMAGQPSFRTLAIPAAIQSIPGLLGSVPSLFNFFAGRDDAKQDGTQQAAFMLAQQNRQFEEQEKRNKANLDRILEQNAHDQKKLLEEHHRQAEKAQQEQKEEIEKIEKQRKEEAKRELDRVTAEMEKTRKEQQNELEQKLATLSNEQKEERAKLLMEQEEQKKSFTAAMSCLEEQMANQEQMHAEKMEEMMKQVEKASYEASYPIPEALQQHLTQNPRSFNIQILGCRGAGKSTFVNKMLREMGAIKLAKRGVNETTVVTAFYEITDKIKNKPERYDKVFLCDQPGIGGLKITEAGYLANFGPGHFNFTMMLGEKGFNEMDMSLLKHLLHNKKPLVFVRSQCDSAISGIQDAHEEEHQEEITSQQAMDKLRETFADYIETNVVRQTSLDRMEVYYIGLPPRSFPDFKRLVHFVLSGAMLKQISDVEAKDLSDVV